MIFGLILAIDSKLDRYINAGLNKSSVPLAKDSNSFLSAKLLLSSSNKSKYFEILVFRSSIFHISFNLFINLLFLSLSFLCSSVSSSDIDDNSLSFFDFVCVTVFLLLLLSIIKLFKIQ